MGLFGLRQLCEIDEKQYNTGHLIRILEIRVFRFLTFCEFIAAYLQAETKPDYHLL